MGLLAGTRMSRACFLKEPGGLSQVEQPMVVQVLQQRADKVALHCQDVRAESLLRQVDGYLGRRLAPLAALEFDVAESRFPREITDITVLVEMTDTRGSVFPAALSLIPLSVGVLVPYSQQNLSLHVILLMYLLHLFHETQLMNPPSTSPSEAHFSSEEGENDALVETWPGQRRARLRLRSLFPGGGGWV
jgi:hypothetical protein